MTITQTRKDTGAPSTWRADAAVGPRARDRRPVPGTGPVRRAVLRPGPALRLRRRVRAHAGRDARQFHPAAVLRRHRRPAERGLDGRRRRRSRRARAERRGPAARLRRGVVRDPAVRAGRGHVPPGGGQGGPPGRRGQRGRDEPVRGGRQRRLLPGPGAGHPGPDRAGRARHRAVPAARGAHLLRAAAQAPPRVRPAPPGAADRPGPVGPVRGADRDRGAAVRGVLRAEHVHRAVLDPPPARLPRPGGRRADLLPGRRSRPGPCSAAGSRTGSARSAPCSSARR